MVKETSRAIVYQTQSLHKAFEKIGIYSLSEPKHSYKYYVRLEIGTGERKTYKYTKSSDAYNRLLGSYRKFVKLQVAL